MTSIKIREKRQKARFDGSVTASGLTVIDRAQLFDVSHDEHSGLMIALFPPPDLAKQISSLPGVETQPDELHITLAVLGGIDDLDDSDVAAAILKTKTLAKNFGPIELKINGIGRFNASDSSDAKDVIYAVIDSPTIDDLRSRLVSALRSVGIKPKSDHGFNPHMTLAYIDSGAESPIDQIETIALTIDEIHVCVGDKRRAYQLTGKRMYPKPVEQLLKLYGVLRSIFDDKLVSRDMALTQVGSQVMEMFDKRNMEQPADEGNYHFFQDLYMGDDGTFYAISISGGRLFKWRLEVDAQNNVVELGVPAMVKPQFTEAVQGRTRVREREDGRFEAFSVMSTAMLNKDGQIDTRALYDSFCERFKGDGREYINIYHLGRDATRIGEIRSIFREENLLVGYYVLDDNLVAKRVAETLSKDESGLWGGSIEFFSDDEPQPIEVSQGVTAEVFTSGTLLGYSIAKTVHGAAWGTEHYAREKMDKRNKQNVLDLLNGDESAVAIVEQWLDERNERIKASGAITRTAEGEVEEQLAEGEEQTAEIEEQVAEEVTDQVEGEEEVERVIELDAETLDMITAAVVNSEWMMGFHEAFMALEARVAALDGASSEEAPVEAISAEEVAQLKEEIAGISEEMTRLSALYGASRPAQTQTPARERVVIKTTPAAKPAQTGKTASKPVVVEQTTNGVPRWRPLGIIK